MDYSQKFVVNYYTIEGYEHQSITSSFMVQDVLDILKKWNSNAIVINIDAYYGSDELKRKMFTDLVSAYKDKDDVIIITCAAPFVKDYPDSEFYDEYMNKYMNENINGKKPIPFDEVVANQSKIIESAGFVDFNFYVQYERTKAYIYPNTMGNKIIDFCKNQ